MEIKKPEHTLRFHTTHLSNPMGYPVSDFRLLTSDF